MPTRKEAVWRAEPVFTREHIVGYKRYCWCGNIHRKVRLHTTYHIRTLRRTSLQALAAETPQYRDLARGSVEDSATATARDTETGPLFDPCDPRTVTEGSPSSYVTRERSLTTEKSVGLSVGV